MSRNTAVAPIEITRVAALVLLFGSGVACGLDTPEIEDERRALHGDQTLPGSDFEIDDDANLVVDHPAPSLDWANVDDSKKNDAPTGGNDDSYAGGSKEDTLCPSTTTGSIPNNKSDLLTFGVYEEKGSGAPGDAGFLHFFWTRVNEPNGTTLMDFEINQSSTDCGNGVNPERTPGDLLIEYRIEQGGATADILVREWDGTAWGPAQDLSAAGGATGTINTSPIPAADSDGLITSGSLSPRTFGEASIDLDFLFDEDKCQSFGSVFLKSRASDAFTSQLKDYIEPEPIQLTNCGAVIIRKQTNPEENPNATTFGFTKTFDTDPSTVDTFSLQDDGVMTFNNVLFGTGYTVSEDVVPANWALQSIDCSASSGVTPVISGPTITFDIDAETDVVDCTYTNQLQQGAILVTKTRKHAADGSGDHPHPGVSFTVDGVTKQTDANGQACFDGLSFASYDVTETVPAGYAADGPLTKSVTVSAAADCSNLADPQIAQVSFGNTPLTNITVSVDSQVDGGTASIIDCTLDSASTAANGDGSLTLSDLLPGTYTCTVVVDP